MPGCPKRRFRVRWEGELARVAGFDELTHHIRGAHKEHSSLLLSCLRAEGDREMPLAGADRPSEDEILRRGHPLATREQVDLRRIGPVCGKKTNASSVLISGKRASRSRCRITDSRREVSSALSTSCR
jgi:hypothetical protein